MPTKSLFMYQKMELSLELVYQIPYLNVPSIYLKIILSTFQWESLGDSINMEIKFTSYIMSSWVDERYIRLSTSFFYNVGSIVDRFTSFLNFVPCVIGVFVGLHFFILNLFKISDAYKLYFHGCPKFIYHQILCIDHVININTYS